MKIIPLAGVRNRKGKDPTKYLAFVDDEDYERVRGYYWQIKRNKFGETAYAVRRWWEGGQYKSQLLHNFILGRKGFDHVDHNGLNCQKHNLRAASRSQNAANSKRAKTNTSGFKGVSRSFHHGKHWGWCSQIWINGKRTHLGLFRTPEEAHAAYIKAAKEAWGEFACAG